MLWLIGGLFLAIVVSIIVSATWDFAAYYGLPESANGANLVGIVFFIILALLVAGVGLLAY